MGKPLTHSIGNGSAVTQAIAILKTCSSGEVAAVLDGLADATGERVFRRAAGDLRRRCWGRRPIDDTEALAEIEWHLQSGAARSVEQAAGFVAAAHGGEHSFDAARTRLARKYRQKVRTK